MKEGGNLAAGYTSFFKYERLPEPLLRFHMRRKYVNPRTGLSRAGPYDAYKHKCDDVRVGLVTGTSISGLAEKFMQHLKNGHGYYKGFCNVFKVNDFIFDNEMKKEINDKDNDVLSNIENAYFELAEKLPDKSSIIIILNDETINRNYVKIKAIRFKYSKKTIRLQLIKRSTLEKALKDSMMLDFTLFNVATAIYAKLGGTPWILDQQLIPAGVFIGIAFTRPKIVAFNNKAKEIFYYGILTVYNKYGRYIDMSVRGIKIELSKNLKIRGTKGLYIPKSHMVEMLKQVIGTYFPPVVIIHKSARFHIDEKEAVKQVLGSRGIDYALIHIESSNPYRGYGEDIYGKTVVRGDLILDTELNNRAILFTTGCTQSDYGIQKRGRPGTPRPLELEVEENTTPYSVEDFAKQVFGLTKLDWNTTDLEVRMPITIKYARRVAALASYLTAYSGITDIRDLM